MGDTDVIQPEPEAVDSFGAWVRARRELLQLAREAVARQVGCAVITLRKIEADERRPSAQIAERLAVALALPAGLRATFVRAARAEVGVRQLGPPSRPLADDPAQRPQTRSNLPAQRSALVGRAADIARVRELLARPEVGLLTLTGPPGVGKTRLGVAVGADLTADFADGVWFVTLAHIRDSEHVATEIAQTLNLTPRGPQRFEARGTAGELASATPVERVVSFVRHREVLLVLDNFEHVLAAAPLVTQLLEAAPRLKLLVTSRAPLHVAGEHELAVLPLGLPDAAPATGVVARASPAVELFVQRAQAVQATFVLDDANAAPVAAICAQLDGLPLAIELAAARVKVLPPAALQQRLAQRLELLTDGRRDAQPRHQTLRAAIAWSYELLDRAEQELFRRLAVFAGGFSIPAAQALSPDLAGSALDLVAALVDKSLVQQQSTADEPRFGLLATLREFADEQLAAGGAADTVRRAHAMFYLAFAEAAEAELQGPAQIAALDRLEAEHDNLRAALRWALDHAAPDVLLRLGAALWLFWQVRGYVGEGRGWLAAILERTAAVQTVLRVQVLNGAGMLACAQSDRRLAEALCAASLALARELGDTEGMAHALSSLATIVADDCDYERALRYCAESLALSQPLGVRWLSGWAYATAGYALLEQGAIAEAQGAFTAGLAAFRAIGGVRGSATLLLLMSDLAHMQGDLAQMEACAREGLELARALGDPLSVAYALAAVAEVCHAHGDYRAAVGALEETLPLFRDQGDRWHLGRMQLLLSHSVAHLGDLPRAAALLAAALPVARTAADPEMLARSFVVGADLAARAGQVARAVLLLGAASRAVVELAVTFDPTTRHDQEQLAAELRARLEPNEFAARWAVGQTQDLADSEAVLLVLCQERLATPTAADPAMVQGRPAPPADEAA